MAMPDDGGSLVDTDGLTESLPTSIQPEASVTLYPVSKGRGLCF
jgi:hypothetical protein